MDAVILVLSFVLILAGAELFTNGIEWFGRKLELAEGAVGSVLAAVGTALPETTIPVIAIIFGSGAHADEVGVGAVLGAPLMLSTLAMFVTGVVVLIAARARRTSDEMTVDVPVLLHDMRTFAVAYVLAIGMAFLPADLVWPRQAMGIVLLVIYALYVKGHFEADPSTDLEDIAPLRFHRLDRQAHRADPAIPRLRVANLQVIAALSFIVVGAWAFVGVVERLGDGLGINEVILALVIAPIATELPEALNAIIWVRQGKHTLAMANITGALVFQATIPTAIALMLASSTWVASGSAQTAFLSAAVALLSSAVIFIPLMRSATLRGRALLAGGVFYAAYLAVAISTLAG